MGREGQLGVGQRGVLITTSQNFQRKGQEEVLEIIKEHVFAEYPELDSNNTEEAESPKAGETTDVSKMLAQELAELKKEKKQEQTLMTFAKTSCRGVSFLRFHNDKIDPAVIVHRYMREVSTTKQSRSRFVSRLFPVHGVCRANPTDLANESKSLIETTFKSLPTPVTFGVVFRARNNQRVDKGKMIDACAKVVEPPHTVDLDSPRVAVFVQVIQAFCLFGVGTEYGALGKFNIASLVGSPATSGAEKDKADKEKNDQDTSDKKKDHKSDDKDDDEGDRGEPEEKNEKPETKKTKKSREKRRRDNPDANTAGEEAAAKPHKGKKRKGKKGK